MILTMRMSKEDMIMAWLMRDYAQESAIIKKTIYNEKETKKNSQKK